MSKNPNKVHSLNVDAIIRDGIRRFTDQIGHLWNCVADYYIRSGLFDRVMIKKNFFLFFSYVVWNYFTSLACHERRINNKYDF